MAGDDVEPVLVAELVNEVGIEKRVDDWPVAEFGAVDFASDIEA